MPFMNIFLKSIFVLFVACLIALNVSESESKDYSRGSLSLILGPAEEFFISLKDRKYQTAWVLLSEKSHRTIINDIYRNSRDQGIEIKKEDIEKDFNSNGMIFNNYWNAFMVNFDPDVVLNKRVWEFEKIESDHAVILLKKKAVTKLQMYKENNQWRVGLVETFWTRKPVKIIHYMQSLFSGKYYDW